VALDAQRWLIGSLAIMLVSGALLFTSEALKCYDHEAFWVKMKSLFPGDSVYVHGAPQGRHGR